MALKQLSRCPDLAAEVVVMHRLNSAMTAVQVCDLYIYLCHSISIPLLTLSLSVSFTHSLTHPPTPSPSLSLSLSLCNQLTLQGVAVEMDQLAVTAKQARRSSLSTHVSTSLCNESINSVYLVLV